MTNHVHFLVSPETAESTGRMMQSLGRRYVRFFNDRYHRTGTLWEGRYKSTLVDTDTYFFMVATYIEMNPVRARMVAHPEEYPWSSFAANALGRSNPLLTPHELYLALARNHEERQQIYRQLFIHKPEPHLVACLRSATNKGWAFGSDAFKASLHEVANRAPQSAGWGGDRKSRKGDQGH
jgi:putative transposase